MSATFRPDVATVRADLTSRYPAKVARKRGRHIVENRKGERSEIEANVRTVPGIISQRGCTYAGCKGVILGPTRDVLSITHGPIGCGYYSWLTRRNQTRPPSDKDPNYMTYCLSTDMAEEQIVFGGEKKLREAVREAYAIFKPPAIAIHATCPVGLIGDDIHQVARDLKAELGINIFAFSCEGYRGVSQSAGHHIANNKIFQEVVSHTAPTQHIAAPEGDLQGQSARRVQHRRGRFRPREPVRALRDHPRQHLLRELGLREPGAGSVRRPRSRDVPPLDQLRGRDARDRLRHPLAQGQLHRSRPECQGAAQGGQVLRRRGAHRAYREGHRRRDATGGARTDRDPRRAARARPPCCSSGVRGPITTSTSSARSACAPWAPDTSSATGTTTRAAECCPTSRSTRTTATSRSSTWSGRSTSPSVATRPSTARLADEKGEGFAEYEGMMVEMEEGSLAIDDPSHYETERLIELLKPDLVCAGIKEKYAIQKLGVPSKQLHSYDYGGPYAGFAGAINFWRDIDQMVNSPIWAPRPRSLGPTDACPHSAGGDRPRRLHLTFAGVDAMLLRHTNDDATRRTALTVNPAKTCQPIGAMYAALGVHRCLAAQSRLARLLLLPPLPAHASLQGTGDGGHLQLHGRLGGLRRSVQSASGHRHHLREPTTPTSSPSTRRASRRPSATTWSRSSPRRVRRGVFRRARTSSTPTRQATRGATSPASPGW